MAAQEMIVKYIRNDDDTFNMMFMCEVVRCKDCKWWRDTDHTCKEHSLVSPMRAEEFCSRGERKDGDNG